MCGIVGVAGNVGQREEKLFRHLLVIDTLRGEHSTGIAAVAPDGDWKIAKAVGAPWNLFETHQCDDVFRGINRVLIGHNRYATVGVVNRKNAHPYEFENVVGVHNGTLMNKHNIPDAFKFDTDSAALYNYIDKQGVEEAIKNTEGAWALVYFNKEDGTLNFLRNKDRPLFYCLSEDGKTIFWASESWMLSAVLGREGYKHDKVREVAENIHLSFDMQIKTTNGMLKVLDKPHGKRIEGKPSSYTKGSWPSYTGSSSAPAANVYVGKERTFKVGRKEVENATRREFRILEDVEDKGKKVRCFFTTKDFIATCEEGTLVTGKIQGSTYSGSVVSWYNVNSVTVSLKEEDFFIPKLKGKPLTEDQFYESHCVCDWCNTVIQYGEECYVHEHGALCSEHMKDPEVAQYFPDLKGAA